MRRSVSSILSALLLGFSALPAGAQQGQPPHAALFGTWTGGIFPAPANISPQACLSQPVVIFTRDLVMRATLTEQMLTQREIQTVRGTPQGLEFRFVPSVAPTVGLLGITAPQPAVGFGCANPNGLVVQMRGENEIVFPNCTDFPNPLVRCPGR